MAAGTSIGKLFGQAETLVNDAIGELTNKKVSDGAYDVKSLSVDTGATKLQLFGTPVTIGASLAASARICAPDEVPSKSLGFAPDKPPSNTAYTNLVIAGKVSTGAEGKTNAGAFQLSASVAANATFAYAHLVAVPTNKTRLEAFQALGKNSTLPQLVDPSQLRDGELIDFNATFNVDLGLKAKYGKELDLKGVIDIAKGVALPYSMHVGFTLDAAFGFSLYDAMHLTIASAAQRNEGWLRVRLDREHRRKITFGAAINLAIDYDAKAGALVLIDKAFGMLPMPPLVDTLKQVAALGSDWNKLTAAIEGKAADFVTQLVDDTGWKQWLATDPRVKQLVGVADWIVTEYDDIDKKVTSIWEELLSRLDDKGFGDVRALITRIASINLANVNLDSLLTGELKDLIHWIETLSGKSVEELILTGKVKDAVQTAIDTAKKIDDFFAKAPPKAVDLIRGFAQRTGAKKVVDALRENATSVEKLQAAGDKWIGDYVSRLVGKVLDKVNESDRQKVEDFANKLATLLNAPQELEQKLKNFANKLKGTAGFNVAVEISRISEFSSVVDVEVNPEKNNALNALGDFLRSGDAQALLKHLASLMPDDGSPRPFDVREIIFTSRHIRMSVESTLISFLGLAKDSEVSTVESTIAFDSSLARDATYIGGETITKLVAGATSASSSSLIITAHANAGDLDDPYDEVAPSFRLTCSREDENTSDAALSSMRNLLLELGFQPNQGDSLANVVKSRNVRFALAVELTDDAVKQLASNTDEEVWKSDALIAARPWFADVDRINEIEKKHGGEMANVVGDPEYKKLWTAVFSAMAAQDQLYEADRDNKFPIQIYKHPSPLKLIKEEYLALGRLAAQHGPAYKSFKAFHPSFDTKKPSDLKAAVEQAANLFSNDQTQWQPPLFNFWFVLLRLLRVAPDVLKGAKGLATIRWFVKADNAWSDPVTYTLPNGVNKETLKQVLS